MSQHNIKKNEMYSIGSMWFCGLFSLSWLIAGILVVRENPGIIFLVLVTGVGIPAFLNLVRADAHLRKMAIFLLCVNSSISVSWSCKLIDSDMTITIGILSGFWALYCFRYVWVHYLIDETGGSEE